MTNAATATGTTRCACSEFEIGHTVELPSGEPDFQGTGTGCDAVTRRTFSPGHDARLKSLLIRAGVAGMEVRQGVLTTDAITAARQFGFAPMVESGILRGTAKQAEKAKKATTKAVRKSASKVDKKAVAAARADALIEKMAAKAGQAENPTELVEQAVEIIEAPAVQVKVGRWTYAAVIVDGDAHYSDANGNTKIAVEGNYKLV